MSIQITISDIKRLLTATFTIIDQWFDKNEELRQYRPLNGGWTIDEIVEHIDLTNHFYLSLLIR
jgi:hypothetical protein